MRLTAVSPQPAAGVPLLSVTGLAARFGPLRALDGVDLTVRHGEVVAIATARLALPHYSSSPAAPALGFRDSGNRPDPYR